MFNLAEVCRRHGITPRGAIHVGAHEGQELAQYLAMGVRRVLMVEANPAVFARLQARIAAAREPGVMAVQRAVSDANGTASLRVTSFDQSSSLLPLKKHLEHYPDIRETHAIEVRTSTIDSLLAELNLRPEDFNLLNVDVQGAELMVMRGAVGALRHVEAIFTEVNFEEMYAGCAMCGDLDAFLEPLDFRRVAVVTPYGPAWGDACYIRSPAVCMTTLGKNGRFGNQLFQYAFLRVYAERHRLRVCVPEWIGRQLFGLNDPPITRSLPRVVDSSDDPAASPVLSSEEPLYDVDLWGYFQFPTTFYAPHRSLICSTFRPVAALRLPIDAAWARLRERGTTVIGVHIRRGDYEDTHLNPHHVIAPSDVIRDWLREVWASRSNPVLFLCSDELPKLLPDFAEFKPVTAADLHIEWPPVGMAQELEGTDFFPEFELLRRCDVLCISNSTFSFAAAMLSEASGAAFYRPTPEGRVVPFDPWDSPVLLKRPGERLHSPELAAALAAYAREQTEQTLAPLLTARLRVAQAWLATPDDLLASNFRGMLGKVHRALLDSGARSDPQHAEPSAEESQMVARLLDAISRGPAAAGFLQAVIAVQLFRRADQLPLAASQEAIPEWLGAEFLRYLLAQPEVFTEAGECDRYHRFLLDWEGEFLRRATAAQGPSERAKAAAIEFAQRANMIPIYFAAGDVREVHARRARLLEAASQFAGHVIDGEPAARSENLGKLRLGILAAHFTPQTETYHTLPYYEHVDRGRLDVTLFSLSPFEHPLARYCASRADRAVHLAGNIAQQVAAVRAADLDVLVIGTNVGAVTNAVTLLALHRLARAQATLFSSPTTTGMRHMDFFVSGELSEGPDAQAHYTERLIRLPGTGFCFAYSAAQHAGEQAPTDVPTRASFGLPADAVVFASGANLYKIIPETIDTWAKIVEQVPGSRLLLYPFGAAWSNRYPVAAFLHMVYRAFANRGLESERLVVLHAQPNRAAVKQCLGLCDVYLDSLRHAGGHSLVDPLEVGLPSVSVEGPFLRSRHGAAMLRSIALNELVAANEVEYVRLAVELGRDAGLRARRREQVTAPMRQRPSFLDSAAFGRTITEAYFQMLAERQQPR